MIAKQVTCFYIAKGWQDIHDCGYKWLQMNAGSKQGAEKATIIKAVRQALEKFDVVGSFNSYGRKLWGSFLVKGGEVDNALRLVQRELMGIDFIWLDRFNDSSMIEKCLNDWAKGDQFILF